MNASSILSDLFGTKKSTKTTVFFVDSIQERQAQKKEVEKKIQTLQKESEQFYSRNKKQQEEVRGKINQLSQLILEKGQDDAIEKQLGLLKEKDQLLQDIERERKKVKDDLELLQKKIENFLNDSSFTTFRQEKKLQSELYYPFNDFQKTYTNVEDQKRHMDALKEEIKNIKARNDNYKRLTKTLTEEEKQKSLNLKQKIKEKGESTLLIDGQKTLTETDLAVLKTELEMYPIRIAHNKWQLRATQAELEVLEFNLFIDESHLQILKKHLQNVKSSIRISQDDLLKAREQYKKQEKEYYAKRDMLKEEIAQVELQQILEEQKLEQLSKEYNVSHARELDEWSKDVEETVESFVALTTVGHKNTEALLLKVKHDLLDARITGEKELFTYQNLQLRIKETYYKITSRQLRTEEQITQELKNYEKQRDAAKSSNALYQEKIWLVSNQLNLQKKILNNIQLINEQLKDSKESIFVDKQGRYKQCAHYLAESTSIINKKVEYLAELTGMYSSITSKTIQSVQILDFIIAEVAQLTSWYHLRPENAISLKGIKNVVPDIQLFLSEVTSYITRFNVEAFFKRMQSSFANSLELLLLLLKLSLFILLLLILFFAGQKIANFVLLTTRRQGWFVATFGTLVALLLQFYRTYFFIIFVWLVIFFSVMMHTVLDPYLYVLLYFVSIIYLLYLINRLVNFVVLFNRENNYAILDHTKQDYILRVVKVTLSAIVPLMFFRQAFLLINYYQSELPVILQAMIWIVCGIGFVSLFSKDVILGIIPTRYDAGKLLYTQVDKYYYLIFLFTIMMIILINPSVGFARVVVKFIASLFFTFVLIRGLLWLHGLFKLLVKHIFFDIKDDVARERFSDAKSWFGLLIVAAFILFVFLGIVIVTTIWSNFLIFIGGASWGKPLSMEVLFNWIDTPLPLKGSEGPITILSLFKLIFIILCGFLVSYGMNKFVYDKIFDLLLIDSGVQNTVTRISRYIIVLFAIFIAFQTIGLGGMLFYLIPALGLSIGFVLKDPMADVIAYFIILVQRPIKIGDYVEVSPTIAGVVRKITPRSVVLRVKNSRTSIVPNSIFIRDAIQNWNYTRGFIAFDDILITIHLKEDPARVKELLFEIVSEHQRILKSPAPIIRLVDIAHNGYYFLIRGFLSSTYTLDQWDIAGDIRLAIILRLRQEGIALATPVVQVGKFDEGNKFSEKINKEMEVLHK
jgi:small-conductance mechanosensitive channel